MLFYLLQRDILWPWWLWQMYIPWNSMFLFNLSLILTHFICSQHQEWNVTCFSKEVWPISRKIQNCHWGRFLDFRSRCCDAIFFHSRSSHSLSVNLFQITNQIVNACKEYIQGDTFNGSQEDILWSVLFKEVQIRVNTTEPTERTKTSRKKEAKELPDGDTLFGKLKACVQLYVSWIKK